MNKLVNILAEQQRILILQLLNEDSDCCLNEQMLQKGLGMFGHNVSLDKVRTEVAWLEEQGCVTTEDVNHSVTLVTLTDRGLDVVNQRAVIPGIDKPVKGI